MLDLDHDDPYYHAFVDFFGCKFCKRSACRKDFKFLLHFEPMVAAERSMATRHVCNGFLEVIYEINYGYEKQ